MSMKLMKMKTDETDSVVKTFSCNL